MKFRLSETVGLLFITACFIGGGTYTPAPRAADKDAKMVASVWNNPGPKWRATKWYRASEDLVMPSRVVISTDDYICIMGMEVDEPKPQEFYVCPKGWRKASGSNL